MKDEQTAAIVELTKTVEELLTVVARAESYLGMKLDDIKESVDQVGVSIDEINKKGRAPY